MRLDERLRCIGTAGPERVTVREGQSHRQIAIEYLASKGLTRGEAFEAVERQTTDDPLAAGFNVWLWYRDGRFGTWITQGAATITPDRYRELFRATVDATMAQLRGGARG